MHRAAAAGAEQDWSEWIGVLGPGFARSPHVASLDLLAGLPGLVVDESGVEAVDELAINEDLPHVRGVSDDVFEDVAREDDRLRTVVVGLVVAAEGLDAVPVQVLGQAAQAKSAAGVEPKDFFDGGCRQGVFNDLTVDAAVALRDRAQQLAASPQEAEIVADAPGRPSLAPPARRSL